MNSEIAHSGAWGIAIIMIVFASWFFYRYIAPKSWREWASAGVVQAFIIALYAEMYGFPLSIYFLARFFNLDKLTENANLWSSLVGLGELGMLVSMLLGYLLLFIGIGIFIKGWRQLYAARQNNELIITGLYRYVRHPQYTGLFIGLFGEGVIHWPTMFSVALFPLIVIAYYFLAKHEERKVLKQFPDEYRQYQQNTPMFIPFIGEWRKFAKNPSNKTDGL